MSVVKDLLDLIKEARELAEKYQDKEMSAKLVDIHGRMIDLQTENSELKQRIKNLEELNEDSKDLELSDRGWYIKKSEYEEGKDIKYCSACYKNSHKLYPLVHGSLKKDYFCTNCKMPYH